MSDVDDDIAEAGAAEREYAPKRFRAAHIEQANCEHQTVYNGKCVKCGRKVVGTNIRDTKEPTLYEMTLSPGLELDRVVMSIIGWDWLSTANMSTDDAAALQIVGWLKEQGFLIAIRWLPEPDVRPASWRCIVTLSHMRRNLHPEGVGRTMAEALCYALLRAVYDYHNR